jgi:hypothetical protein
VIKCGFHPAAQGKMLKWILTLVIAIFLLGIITPHLARFIRFGKLPGDMTFRLSRPDLYLPVRDDDHFLAATLAGFTHHLAMPA